MWTPRLASRSCCRRHPRDVEAGDARRETRAPSVSVTPPVHHDLVPVAIDQNQAPAPLVRPVAFRFALDPDHHQERLARQLVGARRFVFNELRRGVLHRMACRTWESELGAAPWTPWGWGKYDLINQVRDLRARHRWLAELPWDVAECAAVDLATALQSYSESKRGLRAGPRVAFPKAKRRKDTCQSFRLRHPSQVRVDGTTITLPGLARTALGRVRVHGPTRNLRRMLARDRFAIESVTISFEHDRWRLAIAGKAAAFHPERCTHSRAKQAKTPVPVGVDLGIRTLAVALDADGEFVQEWEGVKPLRTAQRRLRRANKTLARTKPGSAGRRTAVERLRRLHARVANLRDQLLQEITTTLVDQHQVVVLEDLNVAGMLRDRRLALGTADAGLGGLRRMTTYKADWYGSELVVADRWFPSSKTCSSCGHVLDRLDRGTITWTCPACGTNHDRDRNAAVNLARWPQRKQDLSQSHAA
jgi:putative transposase